MLKLFLVFCLFHIQVSLTLNDFKISFNSNTTWANTSDSQEGLSYSEDQSTDFNPAQGSKAENFAKSMLSVITMMVIGLVGINVMMRYTTVSADSKIFAIGAVTYFVGELLTTIHAIVQIVDDIKESDEKTDSQLGNLESL